MDRNTSNPGGSRFPSAQTGLRGWRACVLARGLRLNVIWRRIRRHWPIGEHREMENHRRYSRVIVPLDVILDAGGGVSVAGTLRDVAIQGAFITCEPILKLGAPVQVKIVLHGGIEDIPVMARAEVVRREENGLGIHFTEIDIDSVEHLRNIIAYNAEEPDVVWDEMHGRQLLHNSDSTE